MINITNLRNIDECKIRYEYLHQCFSNSNYDVIRGESLRALRIIKNKNFESLIDSNIFWDDFVVVKANYLVYVIAPLVYDNLLSYPVITDFVKIIDKESLKSVLIGIKDKLLS